MSTYIAVIQSTTRYLFPEFDRGPVVFPASIFWLETARNVVFPTDWVGQAVTLSKIRHKYGPGTWHFSYCISYVGLFR